MNMPTALSKAALVKRFYKKADVLFCVCTHRAFNIDAMTNAMGLWGQSKHKITWMPMKGDALVDRARSRAASYFLLERSEDILFFVDDDGIFDPKDVIKTIDNIVDGKDICGGLVMLKKPQTIEKGHIDKNVLFFKDQEVTFSKDAKPVEINMLGTGFMGIHRRVLQEMARAKNPDGSFMIPFCHPMDLKFYPFFQPYPKELAPGKWVYLSEDWAFCDRARKLGFKVWLDPSIFIDHVGEYSWNLADALRPSKIKMGDEFKITLR